MGHFGSDQGASTLEELKGPLATLWGVYYPTGYVVAVLDDADAAAQATQSLTAAGFSDEDIRVRPAGEVLERHERTMQGRNIAERLVGAIHSDEREALDEYIAEARNGKDFVTVHAEHEEQVHKARAALVGHSAYAIRHYDKTVLHDLT